MSASLARGTALQRGFTLVELITVMVIIGIIAAMGLPRFFERSTFDSRGFYDQTISTLRYAQKTAISQRRLVCVTFPNTGRITLRTAANFADVACNTDLQNPTGQTSYTLDAPSGVVLSVATDFNFDALGRPRDTAGVLLAVQQVITVSGYATPIRVEMETGYVH